jgi:hypothetical protein
MEIEIDALRLYDTDMRICLIQSDQDPSRVKMKERSLSRFPCMVVERRQMMAEQNATESHH